ncbi:MAG: helix-hairpin-helix domain-containing protein [Candidatus Bathyarchaeia archaeon]
MRSDYALYTVAIIFFILAGMVLIYPIEFRELWIVATVVSGLFFLGLGYSQRLKAHIKAVKAPQPPSTPQAPAPPPPPPTPPAEVKVEEKPVAEKVAPSTVELTRVKGIKEKRAEQLRALGINNAEDLAKASAKDLATKLKISPKIVRRWIEEAKALLEKS